METHAEQHCTGNTLKWLSHNPTRKHSMLIIIKALITIANTGIKTTADSQEILISNSIVGTCDIYASCAIQGIYGALMVTALDCRLRTPGSRTGSVMVLCSWAKHFIFTDLSLSRSTNGYQQTVKRPRLIKYWEVIFIVASCCGSRAKIQLDEPNGSSSSTNFAFLHFNKPDITQAK